MFAFSVGLVSILVIKPAEGLENGLLRHCQVSLGYCLTSTTGFCPLDAAAERHNGAYCLLLPLNLGLSCLWACSAFPFRAALAAQEPARGTAGGTGRGIGCHRGRPLAVAVTTSIIHPLGMGMVEVGGERSEGGIHGRHFAAGVFGDAVAFSVQRKRQRELSLSGEENSVGNGLSCYGGWAAGDSAVILTSSYIVRLAAAGIGVTACERSERIDCLPRARSGSYLGVLNGGAEGSMPAFSRWQWSITSFAGIERQKRAGTARRRRSHASACGGALD